MVTKTLTITEDAYNALKRMKTADESFSEVITRITGERKGLPAELFGIAKGSGIAERIAKRRKDIEQEVAERNVRFRKMRS